MNPNYPEYEFTPKVAPHPWENVFRGWTPPEANEVADLLLRYDPAARLPPLYVLMHRFFDVLRKEEKPAHKGLFAFREDELLWAPTRDRERLLPKWSTAKQGRQVKVERL